MVLDLNDQVLWGESRQALTTGAIAYDAVHSYLYFFEGNGDFADGRNGPALRSMIHVWKVGTP